MRSMLHRLAAYLTRHAPRGKYRLYAYFRRTLRPGALVESVRLGPVSFRMELHPQYHIDEMLHYFGLYGEEDGRIFAQLVRPGDVVVDLGGNIGYFTLAAALLVGPHGQVHTFEPYRPCYERLLRNVQLNGLANVTVNNLAVADKVEQHTLHVKPGDPGSTSFGGHTEEIDRQTTESIDIDSYCAEHGLDRVDVIKMDIEGAEFLALQGMRETLRRAQPLLFFELNPTRLAACGSSTTAVVALLRDAGYALYLAEDGLTPLEALPESGNPNVLAVPENPERQARVEQLLRR